MVCETLGEKASVGIRSRSKVLYCYPVDTLFQLPDAAGLAVERDVSGDAGASADPGAGG